MKRLTIYIFCTLTLCWLSAAAFPQTSIVSGRVNLLNAKGSPHAGNNTGIVVWLTPASSATAPRLSKDLPRPSIVQRNKRFETRVLAVEVGTTVDFPNKDPFFHNVFSEYGGQRFDLKLYEAGRSKSIRFDKAGICYVFCNIHSQMSAVVVVVDTPHFAVLNGPGEYRIANVLSGRYQLNVWAEKVTPEALKMASRAVTVEEGPTILPTIQLQESGQRVPARPNKYGKDYDTPVFSSPIYTQP